MAAANADEVVVTITADVAKFNSDVKASASGFQQSMGAIEQSAGKAEAAHGKLAGSAGNSRIALLELQHVTRGSVDQFAAGAPLTQIFAQHIASVGQAASLAGGSFGKFGAVLGGPWGIAATAAIAIITTLISKHHEEGDSVESLVAKLREHADKTQSSSEADKIWAGTIGGLIERNDKLIESLQKRLKAEEDLDAQTLANARHDLGTAQKAVDDADDKLQRLRRQLAQEEASPGPIGLVAGALVHGANPRADSLRSQIKEAEAEYLEAQRGIGRANEAIVQSQIATGEEVGRSWSDMGAKADLWSKRQIGALHAIEQANHGALAKFAPDLNAGFEALKKAVDAAGSAGVGFDATTRQSDKLNNQLSRGEITVVKYRSAIEKLAKALQAQADAAKAAKNSTPEFGRQIGFADAAAIARGAGLTVTSAQRSTAKQAELYRTVRTPENPVAKPGTSAHEGVNGKWALDIAFAPGLSAEKLKKLYGDQGVTLSAVYKETGHFHIEGSRSQAAAAENAAARQAEEAKRAANQETERERAYSNEKAALDDSVLDARKALGLSAQETADIEAAAVKLSHDRYQQNLDALQAEGKLHADEYATLKQGNDDLEKLRLEMVRVRQIQAAFAERQAAGDNAAGLQAGLLNAQADALHSQEQLATTAAQRKAIADRLIDLQLAEEQIMLKQRIADDELLIAKAASTKNQQDIAEALKAEADLAVARAELANAPQKAADAHGANAQQNADPLQNYLNSIPDTADEINEALENVAASGLSDFVDGVANAVAHFQSLGDVGRAALQSLTAALVKLALQEIIAHTVGQTASAASNAASVAQAAATATAISALMAGPAALVSLATAGSNAIGAQAGIATTIGLATVLGAPKALGGRIFGPGGDSTDGILTPSSRDEYMIRASSARAIGYEALDHMNRTGTLPGFADGLNTRVTSGGGAYSGITSRDVDRLETAIHASRSDISLYTSLDPADMLQRALGSPPGHRALLAHLGANSGAVNATLRR